MTTKRISPELKNAYNLAINDLLQKAKDIESKALDFEKDREGNDSKFTAYYKIAASKVYLETIEIYAKINQYNVQLLDNKNDNALTLARKNIAQVIKLLESIVGTDKDSLTENEELLKSLKELTPRRILNLLKKIDYNIALLEKEEGENSKHRWTIVELYGKFAIVTKNFINFKEYALKIYDPRVEYYEDIVELINFCKKVLQNASQKYRTKYEVVSHEPIDMNKAIDFQNLLLKINIAINNPEDAETNKRIIAVWTEKLEKDQKKKEEIKKKQK